MKWPLWMASLCRTTAIAAVDCSADLQLEKGLWSTSVEKYSSCRTLKGSSTEVDPSHSIRTLLRKSLGCSEIRTHTSKHLTVSLAQLFQRSRQFKFFFELERQKVSHWTFQASNTSEMQNKINRVIRFKRVRSILDCFSQKPSASLWFSSQENLSFLELRFQWVWVGNKA